MDADERQFLLTAVWLFYRHGQRARARVICEALVEDNPQDGVGATALADMLLADHDAERALQVLRAASYPPELQRAEALLESRALAMLGRLDESEKRWKRYVASSRGGARNWVE